MDVEWLGVALGRRNQDCYPDEHYIPTVIALEGLSEETDCIGR